MEEASEDEVDEVSENNYMSFSANKDADYYGAYTTGWGYYLEFLKILCRIIINVNNYPKSAVIF